MHSESVVKEKNSIDTQGGVESCCSTMLARLGEDIHRDGLLDTPRRFAKAMEFLTSGYDKDVEEVINGALFSSKSTAVVMVKDIDFFSLCEHHLLPFFGKVHIAYLPTGKVLGLSKFARVVEVFCRRLQIQEQLNEQIADTLENFLKPRGILVSIEASHLCMAMRGVQKLNSKTLTTVSRGEMKKYQMRDSTIFKMFNSSNG